MGNNRRISYRGQASGEYDIYVDGKFYCKSDNYRDLQEDLKEIEAQLEKEEEQKKKESTN